MSETRSQKPRLHGIITKRHHERNRLPMDYDASEFSPMTLYTKRLHPFQKIGGNLRRRLSFTLCLLCAMTLTTGGSASDLKIPSLGNASAGLISPAQEYELGQKVLRYYRASMPTSHDPFIETYLKKLIQRLVSFSDLDDKRIELLVLESPTLNAFAAPGGIIGVNTGTFLVAKTEQQLSSIIAHEIAHLSQRHYARSVQKQKKDALTSLGLLLASIAIASADFEAGVAAISASQAGAIDSRLRFSRTMEAEADRLGMQTMVRAGVDPNAMPEMFENLMEASRFRAKIPEFLLSHPVTESRISDSRVRANRYPKKHTAYNLDFQIVRARAIYMHTGNDKQALALFESELQKNELPSIAARYGLIMALTALGEVDRAAAELEILESEAGKITAVMIAKANLAVAKKDYKAAQDTLENALQASPSNHVLNVRLAEVLMEATNYKQCEELLVEHVKRQPENPYVWYLLAEVHGLAGNILDVHKARAEYFILHGIYPKAEIQLKNALKLAKDDFKDKAIIEQRLYDLRQLQKERL